MTCIVAIVDKEKKRVVMGADSAGTCGMDLTIRKDPKIFKNGQFLIGCTSSFRMIQILNHSFKPPTVTKKDIFKYMCTDFVDEVREVFKRGGFLQKYEEGDDKGGCFLVAYKDRLFQVQNDFQVSETTRGYDSIGCGSDYALGSIYSAVDNGVNMIVHNVVGALKTATYFSAGVCEPFNILTT